MVNQGVCNNNIVLELSLNSSMLVEHNTTKKPCSNNLNFDPSLTLALSGDHKKKPACYHGSLYGQNNGSHGGSSLISAKSEEFVIEEEEDDVDNNNNSVNGRKKLRLTKAQSALLEETFKHHSNLNPKQKQELARELKLRPRQVEVWYQNRRARTKLKQTEVECEYLKKCCEALKEENTRLHKELQELKAVKQSTQPPYMQLPVATLTMCPSCKRVGNTTSSSNNHPLISMASKPHFFNPCSNPSAAC